MLASDLIYDLGGMDCGEDFFLLNRLHLFTKSAARFCALLNSRRNNNYTALRVISMFCATVMAGMSLWAAQRMPSMG